MTQTTEEIISFMQENYTSEDLVVPTSENIKKIVNESRAKDTDEKEKEKDPLMGHLNDPVNSVFSVIESYFGDNPLIKATRIQTESYNHFIDTQAMKTIQMFNPVIVRSDNDFHAPTGKYLLEVEINYENLKIQPPYIHENNGATKIMYPQEARLRNFDYSSNMTIDMHIKYHVRNSNTMDSVETFTKVIPKVHIGKMPIMVKSNICVLTQNSHLSPDITGECPMDCGGYFIIKGTEKIVLGQERACENKVFCFDGKKKRNWYAEIKSVPDFKCISPKHIELNLDDGAMLLTIPRIKTPVELFVVFRALGVVSDKSICEHILLDTTKPCTDEMFEVIKECIERAKNILTEEEAIDKIASYVSYVPTTRTKDGIKNKRDFALEVLSTDLFPHCKTKAQKIYMLGYMAHKLLLTMSGLLPPDDRDSYTNKRIELTGTLINTLFRNYVNKMVKEQNKAIVSEIEKGAWRSTMDYTNIINEINLYKIIKPLTIQNGIKNALSTGDFSIKQSNSSKAGVAQVLNRLTYLASLSHIRRINTPLEKNGELIAPRKLHGTTWGFLCPPETPEGHSIGIVKNISTLGHITIPTNSFMLYEYVNDYIIPLEDIQPTQMHGKVKVIINGCWIGIAKDAMECYNALKDMKYKGIINIYTSIVFDYKMLEIRVCNDGGRLTRPVFKVKDNSILLTNEIVEQIRNGKLGWNDLLTNCQLDESVIEYIDPDEQDAAMIAMKCKDGYLHNNVNDFKFTHCEIHPSTIFGILASCIPFPEHNQAPRNTYQCAMGKQAIGMFATNFDKRMDKSTYVLTYPSKPLVDTRYMNFLHLNKVPSGCQIHVAIMTHTGYNQEDSVLVNRGSVDRGLFAATIYHVEKDEDKNATRDEIIRCNPDKTKTRGIKFHNYDKVQPNGFMKENDFVENRDIIIARVVPIKENRNDHTQKYKYEDQSKMFRTTEESYIDKNYTSRNGDGNNFAKVRTRILRGINIGDKFSSRHGQKGTCGCIVEERDMPYTQAGIRPDIIINPHAIPSRMTIAQLKETILGKVLVKLGLAGDGTAFGDLNLKTITDKLLSLGMEGYGNELMYNGMTGEQMECSVFIGPVYYQRLKHMVNDKQHSRSYGPTMNLTRQPAEGRSRDGGFRIGEMERDAMVAHGMAKFCRERLMEVSDLYTTYVCKKCGLIAPFNDFTKVAKDKVDIVKASIENECITCGNTTEFGKVEIPYAYKLLSQELQTINVAQRLILD